MQFLSSGLVPVLYAQPARRSTRLKTRPGLVGVEDGIEVGIVVHLHLAVELETAGSGEDFGQRMSRQRARIGALLLEQGEAGEVFAAMLGRGGGAVGLLGGVVDLERQDREAVDHEAGGFGVQGSGFVLRTGGGEQEVVDGFDEIVAALVEGVDGVA